jgi:predicted transcriptional regulator
MGIRITTDRKKIKRYRYIKSLLSLQGITVRAIAKQLNVSQPMVSQVLTGDKKGLRIRHGIAEILGKKYEELWPREEKKK